jgi:hypothetical protein
LATLGFEWRTKSQIVYLGGIYHRPFNDIELVMPKVELILIQRRVIYPVSGNYLTIDLRYFFHEDPERQIKN